MRETPKETEAGVRDVPRMGHLRDFSWLMAGRLLRLGLSVTVGAWVARHLAPADFGELSYQMSIVALLSALAGAGLDGLVVRELVRSKENAGEIIGTAVGLRLATGTVLYALLLGCWAASGAGATGMTMAALLGADLLLQSGNVFDLYFQARSKNKWPVLAGVAAVAVSSAVRIALILGDAKVIHFAAAVMLEGVLLAGGLAGFYCWRGARERWRFSWRQGRALLAESWPMVVSAGAIAGCMRIDQVMLKAWAGEAAVGVYAAAARLGEAWYFVPMFIGTVLNPWILEGRLIDEHVYRRRMMWLYGVTLWTALAIAGLVWVVAPVLITGLYGKDYAAAVNPLRIHVFGGVFLAIGIAAGKWFLAEGHTQGLMRKALLGLAVSVAANAILIPRWGVSGAAMAAAAGHCSANVIYDLLDRRVRPQLVLKLRAVVPWRLRST